MRAGSSGSHGRRGRGSSPDRANRLAVRGGRERDPHAPRRGVARGAHQGEASAGRSARERRSLVRADERAAVGRIGDAQTDPQRAVGEQALADDPGGALGSEHEMHAQCATARGDIGEHRVQLRVLAEERRELVDHDDQPRQLDAGVEDVAGARPSQFGLPPAHFGTQALDGSPCPRAIQVGDDAGDVGHIGEDVERGAALEVGEEEAHVARRMRGAQRHDPGHEQFGLARAGDAGDHGVRTVRNEIDHQRLTPLDPDDRRQAPPRGGRRIDQEWAECDRLERVARSAEPRGASCKLLGEAAWPAQVRRPPRRSPGHRRRSRPRRDSVRRRSGPPRTRAAGRNRRGRS